MEIFWIFFAMPALGLLYTACVIGRDRESVPHTCACSLDPSYIRSTAAMTSRKHREVRRISTQDLRYLVYKSDDLILIDLRPPLAAKPIPLPAAHILSVSPDELEGLLRWLPPATSAALWGGTYACASAAQVCHGISGTAPIYVLAEAPEIAEPHEANPWSRSALQP
jgi:hypothetical protein